VDLDQPTKRVLNLPTDPASAGAARRWMAQLDLPLNQERAEQLRFLANELVTNSIRHASGRAVSVEAEVLPHAVRVSILDDGDGDEKPTLRQASIWHTGGRGLALVDRLSSRWGQRAGAGTVVWFEIDREDASVTQRARSAGDTLTRPSRS
jgi:anti-sigma regulatory factor (Ser/Thr protein kinase)